MHSAREETSKRSGSGPFRAYFPKDFPSLQTDGITGSQREGPFRTNSLGASPQNYATLADKRKAA